jgi:hypothetical protein
MTDVRKCDGPNCDKEAPLGDNSLYPLKSADSADYYITVECSKEGTVKHFHNQACMSSWANQETKR